MNQCFKIKQGTAYADAVKQYFELLPRWKDVIKQLGEYLDENIQQISPRPESLIIDVKELNNPENIKLFTNAGKLKKSSKRSKEIREFYENLIKEYGLTEFESLSLINFTYGIMRYQGDKLESYTDGVGNIYYKATFDLEKRSNGSVEPITEIEYEETYLNLLKQKQAI